MQTKKTICKRRLRSSRYDHIDRRVQKITPAATHTYFYDGWLLIKEIVASTNGTTDVIEYHWGKDLSGTIGGAGGVGGLLEKRREFAVWLLNAMLCCVHVV